ncbi:MAG: hypothetical protein Q8L90_02370 [Bacteroidota bacterium]|nr:hypothetical protein [Bacteroidota bacterium]
MKFSLTYLWTISLIFVCACSNNKQEENIITSQPEKSISLLDSLKANDTLFINYRTDGCEHHFTEQIKIYKRSEGIFTELDINRTGNETNPVLTKLLSDSSLVAYAQFENKGKVFKSSGLCTTKSEFIISLKTDSIKFEDSGCEFDGYYKLKNKLFGQSVIKNLYKRTNERKH